MFRSKIFSILQNTIHRNLYNNGHPGKCALFSSNTSDTTLTESSKEAINTDINVASVENSTETLTDTSSQIPTNISTEASTEITTTYEDTVQASFTNTSSVEKYQPDKLYKKIEIEVRGHDPAVLKSYVTFTTMAARHLELDVSNIVSPRKPVHERLTLLKSVHVHKKHRVQYETRTYYKYFELFKLTGSTADTYLEYIERNLPEGVAMKVTKVELNNLPETVQQA
nr:PREDICTED: 28S ribosomal protein S10, mitochondrial-like isoform X1 [Megachile rotundata]